MSSNDRVNAETRDRLTKTTPAMDLAVAKQLLLEIKDIMDCLGVRFFLRQGTCLGAVRESGFIPWDDDIDLGVILEPDGFTEQSIDPLLTAFRENEYFVQAESSDTLIYASLLKHDVRVDLIFHRVIKQHIYHFPGVWLPVVLFSHLKEIDFLGKIFLVPNPPEEYLRIKYGADWQTPKRLDYAKDVVNNIPVEHVSGFLGRIKRSVAGFLYPRNVARLMVIDEKLLPVHDANIRIVGVGNYRTNKQGYAKLYLQTDGSYSSMATGVSDEGSMYSIVISYGDHEEVLYEEIINPKESYLYKPDPAQTEGRIFVLSKLDSSE